jgi:hypothetical protein
MEARYDLEASKPLSRAGVGVSGSVVKSCKSMLSPIERRCRRFAGRFLSSTHSLAQVPSAVRGSVIDAERETERFATIVRLGIVLLIGALFVALVIVTGRFRPYVSP